MSKAGVLCLASLWLVGGGGAGLGCRRSNGRSAMSSGGTGGGGGSTGVGGPGGGATAGSGGVAGIAGGAAGTTAGVSWLADPRVWTAVPGAEICGLYSADVKMPGGPAPRVWSSCGVGCSEASARILPGDVGVHRNQGAAVVAGEVYLRLVSGSASYGLAAVTRLSDGRLIAAVQQRVLDTCVPLGGPGAPFLISFTAGANGATLGGLVRPADGSIVWSPILSNLPLKGGMFANELGWGSQFQDGSVRVLSPPTAQAFQTIDQGLLSTFQASGLLDRIVWSSVESGRDAEVVKAYSPTAGVQILASQDTNNHTVALSDTKVAWIGTTGPQRHDGTYASAQLFWAPWPQPLGPASIQSGPMLPATNDLLSLATGGDFAATIGCGTTIDTCQLLVVQLSTNKLWQIHHRPASVFLDVIVVSTDQVLLNEIDYPGPPELKQQVQRLVRLELARLDDLERAW